MSKRGFVKLFTHSLHVLLCSHEKHHEQKRFCQVVYPQFTCSALLSRTTSWAKEVLSSCLPTVYMFCSSLTNNIMSKRGFVKLFTHSLHVLLCSHEQHYEQKSFCQVVYPQFTCSALLSRTTSWAKEALSSCLPTVYMFCSALTNNILSKRCFVNLFTHSLHVLLCSHEQHHEQKRFCQVVYPQFTCPAPLSRTTSWAKEFLSSGLTTVYMFFSALTNNIMSKIGFVKLFTHSLLVLLCSHEQHHEQKRFCQVVYPQFTCSALLSWTTSWAKEVLSSCLPTVYMFCSALTNNIMSKRGFVQLFTHSLHVLLCSHEQQHEQKRFCQVVYPQFTCSALFSRTTSWAKEVLSSCLPTVYMFCSALMNNIMSKRGFVKLFTHSLHVLLCSHEQHHEQKRFRRVVYPQFTCSALLSRTTSWAKEVLSSCLPTVYMFCSSLTNNILSKRGFVKLFTHSLHVLLCSHEKHHEQKRFCQVVYPQFTCSALLSRTTSWAKEVLSSCLPTVYMFCSSLTNNIVSKRGFVKLFTHSLHVLLCSHEQHHEQKSFCQVVYPQFRCSALLSRTTSWAKEDLSSCLPTVYMFCSALTNNIMSKRGFVKLFTHSLHVLLCSHEQHHEQKRFCQVVYPQFTCSALLSWTTSWAKEVLSSCLPTIYMFCSALTNNIMSKRGFVKLFTHSLHVLLCSHEQHPEQKRFCQLVYPQFTCSALLSRTTSWAKEVLSSCLPTVYMSCSALTNNIMSKRVFVKWFTHSLHVLLCSHEQHHEQNRFCQVVYPQFTCSALLSRTTSWAKEVLSSCLPTVYMFCSALMNNIMSKRGFVKLFTHSLHVLLCSHEQHHEQKRFCPVVYPQFTCSALLSRTTSWAKEVLSSCLPTVYMFCSALTNNIMSKRGFVKLFTHSLHVLLCSHEQHPEQKRFCQLVYPQFTCSALLSRTTSWAKEVLSSCLPPVYMSCSALTNNIMSKRVFVKWFTHSLHVLLCSHEQHHEQNRFCQVVYPQFTCSALLSRTTSWAKEVLSSCLPTVYMFCSALMNNIMSKRGFVKLFTHSLHVLLCSHEQHHEQKRFCPVVYPQFTCSALLSRTTSWAKEVLSSCLPTVYMFCSALTNNIMSKRGFVKLYTNSLHVLLCSHEQHHEQKSFCQVVYPQFTCSALLSRTTSWAKELLSSCLPTV